MTYGGGARAPWRVFSHKSILFGINDYLLKHTALRSSFATGAIPCCLATVFVPR